ncbi:MAG TPA: SDR family NAD(P)-dependent oxidoreductase [Methylomirabilota bacterium]|nr:SDR family NAD(P)-dependent oxidoreductase [Methylomirabilota bacterium]
MTGQTGRLAGRLALITGASRGLGAAVAKRFAAEGARTVLVARTVGGLEEVDDVVRAGGRSATLVPFDLTDFDAIDRLGQSLYERFGRLDVLVGNAGMLGTLSPVGHIRPAEWAEVINLNLTANWRLLRSLDPLLRASDSGRVIFVTADLARAPKAFWGAYAASKAGLEALVRVYADEVARTPIRVNLIDPGPLRTALRARAFPGERPESVPAPESVTDAFVALAESGCVTHGATIELGGAVARG